MIKASLLYAAITVLLALIDTIRIKKAKGIVKNINHKVSEDLAIYGSAITLAIWTVLNYAPGEWHWNYLIHLAFFIAAFICVRWIFYNPLLNVMRRLKIDYESPITSSYVDQHTTKLTFWDKIIFALGAWVALVYIHYLIFKS